jgi:hypothetical protein
MKKLLSCLIQSSVLAAGLVYGTHVFAQEPGFPPETSAPPPQQGLTGDHWGPAQELAGMIRRYNLSTVQQNQVKPILKDRQRMRLLLLESSLSPRGEESKDAEHSQRLQFKDRSHFER